MELLSNGYATRDITTNLFLSKGIVVTPADLNDVTMQGAFIDWMLLVEMKGEFEVRLPLKCNNDGATVIYEAEQSIYYEGDELEANIETCEDT